MTGAHKTPDMLAINPWHQMPNMTDGDVSIGESGAIVRYIANTYAPQLYGAKEPAKKAAINWALEWMCVQPNYGCSADASTSPHRHRLDLRFYT